MLNKVIALGLLPLLIACNSSESNNQDTVLPGGPGIDIESPDNGNGNSDCNSSDLEWCSPGTDNDSDTDLTPGKNPVYSEVAEYFSTSYQSVHDICETHYSDILPVGVDYNLTCDWVDDKNFVIIYTEFADESQPRGEYSTIMLTVNHDYLNHQSLGFNALLYYPTSDTSVTVESFSLDITEQLAGWDYAKVNSFQFQSITSNHDLLIKTDEPNSSILMSDLIGSDAKRFRLYSEVEIESGNATVYDYIANYELFYLIHSAFRAS